MGAASPRFSPEDGDKVIDLRPFAWYDLWMLYRSRGQVQFFDSALAVTRGTTIGLLSIFGHLNPNHISFTGVMRVNRKSPPLVGQMHLHAGEHSARVSYILPERSFSVPAGAALLEGLAYMAADYGAFHLLAEVEERNKAVDALRMAGFSVYGWQRVWRFEPEQIPAAGEEGSCWETMRSRDQIAIRSLYQTLAPPLVQGAEPLNGRTLSGLVYRQDGEILAYAEGQTGPRGVYLNPIIHPDVSDPGQLIRDLLANMSRYFRRPIHIAVRSYQSWVEGSLSDLGGDVCPRQALMIKHMVNAQRVAMPSTVRNNVLENRQPVQPVMAGPKVESSLVLPGDGPEG